MHACRSTLEDPTGKAVLTDFGLAVFIDRHDQLAERAGTPAYMAPEQLEGKGVTARSDLYSLGLILHEIFTGRQVYAGESLAEVLKQRLDSSTASSTNLPSSILPDLDPVIERIVLQCLERDPARRPASALALLTALPGGNPLAAALAAGETPSPELVAACGSSACFCPYKAAIAAAILLVSLIAIAVLSKWTTVINLMSPEKPPAELAGHARDLLRELGYPAPKDVAYGYSSDLGYVPHVEKSDTSADRWKNLKQARTTLAYFWYRQSPTELVPSAFYASPFGNAGVATGQVTGLDPAPDRPGMISVQTDMHGRLLLFRANPTNVATDASTGKKGAFDPFLNLKTHPGGPRDIDVPNPPTPAPQIVRSAAPTVSPTWQPLFKAAAIDTLGASEVEPTMPPPVFGNQRKAWLIKSQQDHRELRVEAAALDGKPVYFQVVLPWQSTGNANEIAGRARTARMILYGQNALLLVAGIFFAWRNLRSGRGDRRGALRLATYVFLVLMLAWFFSASHIPSHVELDLLYLGLARALFSAGLVWLFYIALETYVRRLWPEVLISWSRLLSGSWRDSLVGRDVLIGTLAGVTFVVLERAGMMLTPLFGFPAAAPVMPLPGTLQGPASSVGALLVMHVNSIHVSLFAILLFLLLLRIIFRRPIVAAAALVVFITTIMAMMTGHPAVSFVVYGLGISLLVFVLVRFGLLAVITLLQVRSLCLYPITLDTNAWYFGTGALAIALIVLIALYGLFTFMPTRATLFRDDLLVPR